LRNDTAALRSDGAAIPQQYHGQYRSDLATIEHRLRNDPTAEFLQLGSAVIPQR
jgi:hypothetical protein